MNIYERKYNEEIEKYRNKLIDEVRGMIQNDFAELDSFIYNILGDSEEFDKISEKLTIILSGIMKREFKNIYINDDFSDIPHIFGDDADEKR